MAKKKTTIMNRSNIPYSQRLLMDKYETIRQHRDDAARVVMHLACVALNNTEGLGYLRLSRFARELAVLVREYYADPEVGQAHLMERLSQMGFIVRDGRIYAAENSETGQIVPVKLLEPGEEVLHADHH